jgi:hypothetical protein
VNPSFSEHRYPHASPPVIEPAQGAPRAIRGRPPAKFVRMTDHAANPRRNGAAKTRKAIAYENNRTEITALTKRLTHEEPRKQIRVRPYRFLVNSCLHESTGGEACSLASASLRVRVRLYWLLGNWCLPESVRGEACSCQDSREGGVQTSSALASTVLLGHL